MHIAPLIVRKSTVLLGIAMLAACTQTVPPTSPSPPTATTSQLAAIVTPTTAVTAAATTPATNTVATTPTPTQPALPTFQPDQVNLGLRTVVEGLDQPLFVTQADRRHPHLPG
jgi:cytoskeletal protein RodZ